MLGGLLGGLVNLVVAGLNAVLGIFGGVLF